jgi:hypothetical protein
MKASVFYAAPKDVGLNVHDDSREMDSTQRGHLGIRYCKPRRQLRPSKWFAGLDCLHANANLAKGGKKPIDIVSFPDNAPTLQ